MFHVPYTVYKGGGTQIARMYSWLPRLPCASAHVMPLGGSRRLAVTVTSQGGFAVDRDWRIVMLDFSALARPYDPPTF